MGRRVYRFDRAPDGMRTMAADAAGPVTLPEYVLRRQEPPMSLRDEVIFLLQTAAEIEHSLLVEYLYAQYSLDPNSTPQSEWQGTILEIAREEMAHLLSMQNLLRVLGGPLNLEREDYPFNAFYPFPFRIEPLTLASVARYVLAEMPDPSTIPPGLGFDLCEVKQDAGVTGPDTMVNRVGALFALLGKLVGQLEPGDFRAATLDRQGLGGEWFVFGEMIVEPVTDRASALDLVERIGAQGEGPGEMPGQSLSHFRKFFAIYQAIKANPGTVPGRPLTINPTVYTTDDGPLPGLSYISHPLANAWAGLFNTRYRILLSSIGHSLLLTRSATPSADDPRQTLVDWAVGRPDLGVPGDMTLLTSLTLQIINLPLSEEGGATRAGPPFDLPYTLNLPDLDLDRWRHHQQLLSESALRIDLVRQQLGGTHTLLDELESIDQERAGFVDQQIARSSGPNGDVT